MKNKSNVFFLSMLLLMGGSLVGCDNSNNMDEKRFEKLLQNTEKFDETYHPIPEQEQELQKSYEKARRTLKRADSVQNTKKLQDATFYKINER